MTRSSLDDVRPEAELAGAAEATTRMLALVDRTPDLGAPSLLPGWSRAHVVAHLVGNARSHIRMLQGTLDGVVADQYAGGDEQRSGAIEQLAAVPSDAVRELHRSAAELAELWDRVRDWAAPVRPLHAEPRPAAVLAWSRWREVEVHAVDLAADYRPADWPAPFVDRLLAELLARDDLPSLDGVDGPRHALAAWLAGRSDGNGLTGELPVIPPWR